jgi:hypothetical protein
MGLTDFAQATFWGAVVIFALIAFYSFFIAKSFLIGFGALSFMLFVAWLGIKINN